MPRIPLIERLHQAWYDLLWAEGAEAVEADKVHEALLRECCQRLNCSASELRHVLRGDFSAWVREANLPPPPKR